MTLDQGPFRTTTRRATLAAASATVALFAAPAHAQNLPNVPGYTPVQQPTADAVQAVCRNFGLNIPTYGEADDNGTAQQRLFSSCRKMVQSANALVGSGPTDNSLGLTNDELRTGVQAIAPVQMNAQKQMSVDASRNNIVLSRLLDLRGGARGLSLALNDMNLMSAEGSSNFGWPGLAGRGGGASTDPPLGERWGAFVNAAYNWGDVDRTDLQDGYDFSNWGLVAGLDYRIDPNLVLGGAFGYQKTKSDYDDDLGKVDATTYSLAVYGTYYKDNWYFDGLVGYGWINYDTERVINIPSTTSVPGIRTRATASPDGNQWSVVVGGGYNFVREATTITPFLRFGYLWVKNDAFSENEPVAGLGLAVDERTIDSVQSALGVRLSHAIGTSFGVVTPYVSAQWNHEFQADQSSITAKYVNDPFNIFFTIPTEDAGSNYAIFTLGLSGQFQRGIAAFVQYGATAWLNDVNNQTFAVGVRIPF